MQPPVLHPFPTRRSSDLKRVAEQGDVRLGDIRATLPANFDSDQAVGFERAQRIAHRDATDAKLLGHLSLGWQTIAGSKLARKNRATNLGDDVAGSTHRSDRSKRRGRRGSHGPKIIPNPVDPARPPR